MKSEDLFLALGELDDAFLVIPQEAAESGIKRRKQRAWCYSTAVITIVVGIVTAVIVSHNMALKSKPAITDEFTVQNIVYPEKVTVYGEEEPCDVPQEFTEQTVTYYDYYDLVQAASCVVIADVVTTSVEENGDGFTHVAQVIVAETFKGDAAVGDTICVLDGAKGVADDKGRYAYSTTLDGGPILKKGNRTLLFLCEIDSGERYHIVYEGLGKFFYDRDGKYHISMTYNENLLKTFFPDKMMKNNASVTLEDIRLWFGE